MVLPECLRCKHGDQGYPCRAHDGSFDFAKAAAAYIECGRQTARTFDAERHASSGDLASAPHGEDADWISDCEYELVAYHPDMILPFVIAAMDACETASDAAWLAAGAVETSLAKHGAALIDQFEALAGASEKVRYILSGVWSQGGAIGGDVWERLEQAIGAPAARADLRSPFEASDAAPFDDAQARDLLRQNVGEIARALKFRAA